MALTPLYREKGYFQIFFIHPPLEPSLLFKCIQATLSIKLYVVATKITLMASRRLKSATGATMSSNLKVSKNVWKWERFVIHPK